MTKLVRDVDDSVFDGPDQLSKDGIYYVRYALSLVLLNSSQEICLAGFFVLISVSVKNCATFIVNITWTLGLLLIYFHIF